MNVHPNIQALASVIGYSEGTDRILASDNGYRALVGGKTFNSYAHHPNIRVWIPKYQIYSTAAGRYQFIYKTWEGLQSKLGLPDFSPESQDQGMVELVDEKGATKDFEAGRFDDGIAKIASVWASLPGAGYGQREVRLELLRQIYLDNGGELA